MLRFLGFIFLLFFVSLANGVEAKTPVQKIFPPYPEVWGYDVSDFPAVKTGEGGIHAYRMDDGDIWFVVNYSFSKDPMKESQDHEIEKYMLIKFFKGEKEILDAQQRKELFKITEGKWLTLSETVKFKDGSTLMSDDTPRPRYCFIPDLIGDYLVKTDQNQNEKKYSILGAYPRVRVWQDEALCDFQGAPFFYQKLYSVDDLIDLGDDTFLAYKNGSNLILRFDKDFNTKFKPINPVTTDHGDIASRNFFVIEYSLIEELEKKTIQREVPLNQTIHDELLKYFEKKYPPILE